MIFPYSTDAPVYHWPHGTLGLIVANVLIYYEFGAVDPSAVGPWLLQYGSGLHPQQWIGSIFMHGGFFHLFGNMLYLWVFGLVVEGKLGTPKFLACYLGIGIVQSAFEQLVMLGYSGIFPGSMGASSAIYGLMAMAAVWAPANNISVFYFLFFFARGVAEVPISILTGCYVGLDFLMAVLMGGWAGSSFLHLSGAALGFPLAVWMLRIGLVDCEGWDLFTRANLKRPGQVQKETEQREKQEEHERRHKELHHERLTEARSKFQQFLKSGNAAAAHKLHQKMQTNCKDWKINTLEIAALVKAMHSAGLWRESAPYMAHIISQAPEQADPIRLKLAQICVMELERPGRALELIGDIDLGKLDDKHQLIAKRIYARAHAMQEDGCVELDREDWE